MVIVRMEKSISFIHAADLHLDSPFQGLSGVPEAIFDEVRDSTFHAFNRLIDVAIMKEVDFVLLVGDLFDNEKQSLKAQVHLRKGFQRLYQYNIKVYLSYGNHDYVLGNTHRLSFPENVHVFSSESVSYLPFEKNNETIAHIYGFSYHQRAVHKNKVEEYKRVNQQIPYHIATLHGTLHGNQDHDPYAPFTLQQLQRTPFDYWALGHIHVSTILSSYPPIIYPGNLQGRHRKETGEKGCYYVKMTQAETTYEFLSLQQIQFMQTELDITLCQTVDEIEQTLLSVIDNTANKKLIYMTMICNKWQWKMLHEDGVLIEIIDIVNDVAMDKTAWKYIYDVQTELDEEVDWVLEEAYIQELEQALEDVDVMPTISDLFHHPIARKYIEQEDEKVIKTEAKKLLQQTLLRTKESDQL